MSTKKRILVIGTGSIGERHTRCFLETGRADVEICELDHKVRKRVAARYQVESHISLDRALENPPDAAVICTPAQLHIPMARQLVLAGCHLLVEKPLSTSLDGVDQLSWEVEQSQRVLAVAYVMRQHPLAQEIKQAVDSGRFGKPLQLVYQGGQHFPSYRPAFRETYYRQRQTGGGAIQDALTHAINYAQWLLGPLSRVAADCDRLVLDGVEVEDTVHVIGRHHEVMSSFTLNQHQAANESTLQLICEQGIIRYELSKQRWLSMATPDAGWTVEGQQVLERDGLFVRQAEMLLDVMEGKREVLCTLAEGIATLQANLAILAAADSGSWQPVPDTAIPPLES